MDRLADALNAVKVAELKGIPETLVAPASKLIREVFLLFQQAGYLGEFEFIDDGKSGKLLVKLRGKINNCKAVKPRFPVKFLEWEKWERRFLPGAGIGLIIVSTPKGLMTHASAKEQRLGGRLVCFVY